jgi:hypothetical protein
MSKQWIEIDNKESCRCPVLAANTVPLKSPRNVTNKLPSGLEVSVWRYEKGDYSGSGTNLTKRGPIYVYTSGIQPLLFALLVHNSSYTESVIFI